jgi:hypothetical protein
MCKYVSQETCLLVSVNLRGKGEQYRPCRIIFLQSHTVTNVLLRIEESVFFFLKLFRGKKDEVQNASTRNANRGIITNCRVSRESAK